MKLNSEVSQQSNPTQAFAQVAHDLRSPLAALCFWVESCPQLSQEDKAFISKTLSRVMRITDTLVEARSASASTPSFTESLEALVSEKRYEWTSRGYRISFEVDAALKGLETRFSTTDLERMLSNLINNSCEAIEEGSEREIRVQVEDMGPAIGISVQDFGKGMPEEFAHQLGNQNLGSTKGVLRGHGLQHAREFLKTIGGGISFSSKLGWGTIAYVWIPKSQLKAAGLNKA